MRQNSSSFWIPEQGFSQSPSSAWVEMLVGLFLFHCSCGVYTHQSFWSSMNFFARWSLCSSSLISHTFLNFLVLAVPDNPPDMLCAVLIRLSISTQALIPLLAHSVPVLLQEESAFGGVGAIFRAEIITFQGIIPNLFIKLHLQNFLNVVLNTECKKAGLLFHLPNDLGFYKLVKVMDHRSRCTIVTHLKCSIQVLVVVSGFLNKSVLEINLLYTFYSTFKAPLLWELCFLTTLK